MFAAENDEIVPVPGRTYSESLESGSRGLYKAFYNSGTERVPSGVSLTSEAFDCRKLDYVRSARQNPSTAFSAVSGVCSVGRDTTVPSERQLLRRPLTFRFQC